MFEGFEVGDLVSFTQGGARRIGAVIGCIAGSLEVLANGTVFLCWAAQARKES